MEIQGDAERRFIKSLKLDELQSMDMILKLCELTRLSRLEHPQWKQNAIEQAIDILVPQVEDIFECKLCKV